MDPFSLKADEMRAEFPTIASEAGIDTEQICIRAINTFPERYADLWNRNVACAANSKKVFALDIVFAVR